MSYNSIAYPYSTVVRITDYIPGYTQQGSGVLIAPDEVLTASHVVYGSDIGAATSITVAPGYGPGGSPFGTAVGVSFHYLPIFDPGDGITNDQSQYDYAVIHLSRPFSGIGVMGVLPGFGGGRAFVTGYPASANGAQVTQSQLFSADPYYSLLEGQALGPGSSGGPVWAAGPNGLPYVLGLVSSEGGGISYNTQITQAAYAQIESWVAQDDSSNGNIAVYDTTYGQAIAGAATPYAGPVPGLQQQYIEITSDNLNVTATTPDWFLHTGSGTDAIAVTSGNNVLDGGTGSNFLSGGTGSDTFFVDDRNATGDIWSTLANFHAGDSATVWGVTQGGFGLQWQDQQGASGYAGLTLHATEFGRPEASLTVVGYSAADLGTRLQVGFGSDQASGSPYLYIHAIA